MLTKWFTLILCTFNIHPPTGCRLNSRENFGQPLPVILRNGRLLEPTDKFGNVELAFGERLTLSCEGAGTISNPSASRGLTTADIICNGGTTFKNDYWLSSPTDFHYFSCDYPPEYKSQVTNRTCHMGYPVIEVGYRIENVFYPLYESCFDNVRLIPLYSKYTQNPYNDKYQIRVERPFFIDDKRYFGSIPVTSLFSPWNQKTAVSRLVGPVIDNYFVGDQLLSRGHLAAKTDFVFAFGERASFHYVNCASQWTGFNGGNWNTLEVDLRTHIHDANYETIIYTGTHGVTKLVSYSGRSVEIYLARNENDQPVIPVPEYFYKVVYEPKTKRGIAFVGINNPYYNVNEARNLFFCEDICRSSNFRWLTWHPDNPSEGYTFCCTVPDFKNTVIHLPEFEVKGVLI